MKYTIESISKEIKARVEEKFSILLDKMAENLAYSILFSPRYTVTHEFDPSWDYSGLLIQLNKKYSLNDYTYVRDFLDEYTGESTASYVNGCGFFYTNYEQKYEEMIREFVGECYYEVLSEINDKYLIGLLLKNGCEASELDKEEIIETITDFELFEELCWYHYEILERIKLISFELLFFRGKEKAMKKYEAQLELMKERQVKMEFEKEVAEKLWRKLQKLYKLQIGNQISKIEMKDYELFKQFLDFHQVSTEERRIMANYLSDKFSNKVSQTLMGV